MLTQPAKVFLPISGLAVAAWLVYSVLTTDNAGLTWFTALAAVALYLAVAVTINRENELAPARAGAAGAAGAGAGAAEDGPATAFGPRRPAVLPAEPAMVPGGGAWPALAALGAGMLALAFVAGGALAVPGAALLVVSAVGWLAGTSGDDTGHVPNLVPIGIPVVGLLAIASLIFFMSRILLAVPEQASTFIAIVVAALIFGVASLIAIRPSVNPRAVLVGLVAGSVLMVGGGLVAAAVGTRDIEKHGGHGEGLHIVANQIKFNLEQIDLPAGQEAVIDFENKEKLPHNVAIYRTEEARDSIFQGAVVTGPITTEYRFPAPPAGTYFFRCDIHPSMKGRVVVA